MISVKPTLINLEPLDYSEVAKQKLEQYFEYRELDESQPVFDQIANASVIISRLRYELSEEFLSHAPNLKFIVSATTGTNHIDINYTKKAKVEVVCLKGESEFLSKISPTAEHTWGLLLALVRQYKPAFASVERFEWRRDQFPGIQLNGKVLGVVGLGRLGKMVAKYGQAFGMEVIYTDTSVNSSSYQRVSLEVLLRRSDIVSIHVPLNNSTCALISDSEFSKMKESSYLLNTSRGEVIDQDALIHALRSAKIAGAALDVISCEEKWAEAPPKDHVLINYAKSNTNLILTPHIGGMCPQAMRITEIFVAEKLLERVL